MPAIVYPEDWLKSQFPAISSLTPLDSGGQKCAYTGIHATDGSVVLKIFHPATDPARALREIQAVHSIESSRIPRIYEVGKIVHDHDELIWVREQHVPGRNLRNLIATGRLSERAIFTVALHVLEALTAAENARIVHRDVKPENIILNDNPASAWLLDFGIARHLDLESITSTAAVFGMGTYGYSPPEQFRNRKTEIDSRADLFALGVTLYECVEGTNPFRDGARDVLEVMHRLENVALPPIARNVEPSGQFRELVVAMTRTRRDHRLARVQDAFSWMQDICRINGLP